ncbi:MAG: hypothetical protein LC793_08385 [Thermomicrobia bacterium]|nr:hypothetical protein [Thermomicrobia bacterium]
MADDQRRGGTGAPGANPTAQLTGGQQRLIFNPQVSYKRTVKNALTITGAGTGISELTLRPLYGNTSFAGYDPAHPVMQRPRQDGGGFDGYDYYLRDNASIAAHGTVWGRVQKSDVGPVVSPSGGVSRVDEQAAAVALYTIGLAALKVSKDPITQLQFTSPGVGDIRNIGGMTVHVQYHDYAFDVQNQVYTIVNIDADYWVTEVVRNVRDDDTVEDTFTFSTNGQTVAGSSATLIGGLDGIAALHAATGTYPMAKPIPKSQNIGPGADMVLTIPADNSQVRRHWALVNLQLEGMVHTRSDTGHVQDVVTAPIPHDIGNAGSTVRHDVGTQGTVAHDVGTNGDVGLDIYDVNGVHHVTTGTGYTYDPQVTISLNQASSKPASAKPVYFDGTAWYWDGSFTKDTRLNQGPMTIHSVHPTSGGTGGQVNPTGGGTGGHIPATSASSHPGGAGTTRQRTHAATSGFGATSAVATQESVYRGPSPTGVTVWVDGTQRFGPFNASPGVLDITPWVSDQNRHTVTIKSPTNGAADVLIDIRDDVATVAVRSTG